MPIKHISWVVPKNPYYERKPLKWMQYICYILLYVLLLGSLFLFIAFANGYAQTTWLVYSRIYFFGLLIYTWFTLIMLFISEVEEPRYKKYKGEKISVIFPCYNEEPALLRRAVDSIVAAKGEKEIIIVDDGSTNGIRQELKSLADFYGIKIHFFNKNKGKRHALHHAITKLISDSEFVVTVDSDTVLDKNALIRIVEPLKNNDIGASTGDVQLLNEKYNWLTRMVAAYYWIGLNVYKKAQSGIGIVVCCSGCLSAYRRDILNEIIEPFVNQEFFGERCTHSEDRHLTNLVLQRAYKVVYVPKAISYTETPTTVRGFLRQQQRWKRGYVRESLYTLSYAWRNQPVLFMQILLWDLTVPFFSLGLMIALVFSVLTDPLLFVTLVLPSWIVFMFVRYMPVLFNARGKIIGLFVYMLFYDLFLYWQSIYALFTFRNKSWITR